MTLRIRYTPETYSREIERLIINLIIKKGLSQNKRDSLFTCKEKWVPRDPLNVRINV